LARNSPTYAKRVVDRLTRRSEQSADFPLSGRRVPEYDLDRIREVMEGPYRMIYHLKPDQVEVIAVLHGARDALNRPAEPTPNRRPPEGSELP